MNKLLTVATARVRYKTCNVLLAFLSFSGGKKEQLGNYMEQSFACITQ